MPILHLIVILALIGFLMWAVNRYVPMSPGMKNLLNIAVIVAVIIWLLQLFGVLGGLSDVRVGR